MPTCPMCGETKYNLGYDDGSVRVCYHCKNWGPPNSHSDHKELMEDLRYIVEEIKFLKLMKQKEKLR